MRNKSRYFDKSLLPTATDYYQKQFTALKITLKWTLVLCPFHDDKKPSLSIHLITGGFHCFACGARGGDIVEFHRQRYQMSFIETVSYFGAWHYE